MNREIKFRAWDKEDSRMIVHEQELIPLKICSLGVLRLDPHYANNLWEIMPIDRFHIMQFTGLLDKNGKEIYEGDIVKHMAGNPEWDCLDDVSPVEIETTSAVEYRHRGFWLTNESFGWEGEGLVNWENIEVIGNIYEKQTTPPNTSDTP